VRLGTISLRELHRRPGRTLLTLLGISLGLATVVGSGLTIRTVEGAYRDLFDGAGGRPAPEVTAADGRGFDPAVAASLSLVPGVRAVVPCVRGVAAVAGRSGNVSASVLGIDPAWGDGAEWELKEGKQPGEDAECLLDATLARTLGLRPGDPVRLWAPGGAEGLRLAGTVQLRQAIPGGLLIVPLARAQRLFALLGNVNSLRILPAMGDDLPGLQAEVTRRLPEGLVVQTAGARGELARQALASTEQALGCLGIVALLAAVFVTLNTFFLNLGERRRQLATLRLLGATAGQVRHLLLGEALLLGLAASAGGSGVGVGLAHGLRAVMEQFLGVALPQVQLWAEPFVLASLLGPGLALAASWLPARWASRVPPLAELHPQPGSQGRHGVTSGGLLGMAVLAVGACLAFLVCRDGFPAAAGKRLLGPVLALLLAGGVLALPLALGPLLRLAALLPLGWAGNLARLQLARHPRRTALTAGVLFIALAVAVGFGHTIRALLGDLRHWYRHTIVADFLVRASMPDTSFLLAPALPESLAGDIPRGEAGAVVDKIAFVPAVAASGPVLVLARTFTAGSPLPLDLQEGDPAAVREGLERGEAVLGAALAGRLGLHRGDRITLCTPRGPETLPIAGTAREYAAGGSALYLEWGTARRLLDVPGVHVFLVSARPGAAPRLATALEEFCARHHLLLQSNAELRGLVDRLVAGATASLWALLALAFLVASLGVVNTLTMNVREQARDLAVLRAVGGTGGQLRRLVLAQGLLLGVVSLPAGAVAGVVLAYVIHRGSAWLGPALPFHIDGVLLAGCCSAALAVALLAAVLPARQASRLEVARALQQ
jgi:putative ABC transport system permease protein